MFWTGGTGRHEIMPIEDLKKLFLTHQDQRTANQWLRKDTAKALHDAKLACAARMSIDASCVESPDDKTVSAYQLTLMYGPDIVQRGGEYKPEHQDVA